MVGCTGVCSVFSVQSNNSVGSTSANTQGLIATRGLGVQVGLLVRHDQSTTNNQRERALEP